MHKKLIFLFSLIFINLNAAQAKSLVRYTSAAAIAAAEVKVRDEHLQAAPFYNTNNPVKIQQLKEVQELLCSKLPGAKDNPIHNIIFDYVQSDFAIQAKWDIDKLPLSDVLIDKDFIYYDDAIFSYTIKDNKIEFLQKFKAHEKTINGCFNLNDGRIVTFSADATIKIWKKHNDIFYLQQTLLGHEEIIYHVILLGDGSLASASSDNTIRIWQEHQDVFKCIQVLRNQTQKIHYLQQINGYLISVSLDNSICLWKRNEEKKKWEFKDVSDNAYAYGFYRKLKNNVFMTINQNNQVLIWKIEDDKLKRNQIIDRKEDKIIKLFYVEQYLVLWDGRHSLYLYEIIDDNWEFVTKLIGHKNNDTNLHHQTAFFRLNKGLGILSSEILDEKNICVYFTVFQENNGAWHRTISEIGKIKREAWTTALKLNDKCLLQQGKIFYVFEKTDKDIDYISGTLYEDPEQVQLQAEIIQQQAAQAQKAMHAQQSNQEPRQEQAPAAQPVEVPTTAKDSSDKALLLNDGKKKKKKIKCVIS